MAQFINKKENLVTEAIDAQVAVSGGQLARLDGYPHIRVVARNDWDRSKVAIVSGGGSGHEPAHVGFVGRGMLTAAVCGDVFASPSVDAVLAGILAVTGEAGCLLVVKNYTGDRLNFGLAAERAKAFGLDVRMVIVDDDIALPDLPQARGVAGTLFVHKIAGALAEQGEALSVVEAAAKKVISKTRTLGMSLSTCTVPGSPKDHRIPEGMAELGLGIHGEAGVEQVAFSSAEDAITAMIDKLKPVVGDENQVALINNLGGASVLEMSVLTHGLLNSSLKPQIKHVVGPASLVTSLDMQGFSISLYAADETEIALLKEPCAPAAWSGLSEVTENAIIALPDGLTPTTPLASKNDVTRGFLISCCQVLIDNESKLNELDSKSGDGDTGSTLAGASKALIKAVDRLPLADHTQLYRAISLELSQTMGGSSGVLLAIFFAATGDGASSGLSTQDALKAGLSRMQAIGGANLGDRSMVDALSPALDAYLDGVQEAASAARAGADATAAMLEAKAGRASYINAEQLKGHVDPGAEAVALLFEHLARKSVK